MTGPLRGVKVLDLTSVVSGPHAAMILSHQGADVIKVEAPEGDIMRRGGMTPGFDVIKPRQALDCPGPEAAGGAVRAAPSNRGQRRAGAEFPARVTDWLGFGEPAARAINPMLIYVLSAEWARRGLMSASASMIR